MSEHDDTRWIFTFGFGHPLTNRYVVLDGDVDWTRALMFELFGSDWAGQYRVDWTGQYRVAGNVEELARRGYTELPLNLDVILAGELDPHPQHVRYFWHPELLIRLLSDPDDGVEPLVHFWSDNLLMPEVDGIPTSSRTGTWAGSNPTTRRRFPHSVVMVLVKDDNDVCHAKDGSCICSWEVDDSSMRHRPDHIDTWTEWNPEPGARPVW